MYFKYLKPLLSLLLMCAIFVQAGAQEAIPLNGKWEFRKVGDSLWFNASVPGTVHTDLLDNKKISDPFYRTNEKGLQWIGREDWQYKTIFNISENLLKNDKVNLVFEGLDTYADVYINGKKILAADNMFKTYRINIKSQLRSGSNLLNITFRSAIKVGEALNNSLPFRIPASDNDQESPKVSVFTRKAGYHYGWDWGPRFVTAGIWRPVYLETMNVAAIKDLFIKQKQLTAEQARLEAQLEVESLKAGTKHLEVFVDGGTKPLYSQNVHLDTGITNLVCSFKLTHPQLWWPNGYGSHKLYSFNVVLKDGNTIIAQKQVKHGMRTIEVVQESGERSNSFYFLVNGIKIFMKGANYIPQDNFLTRVTRQRYEHVINTAVVSHMTMLRVWGGGIYENDAFYDLCDENGIMIWQDFMFACAMQPPFEDFKQNVYDEAVQNVKRLRNHSSLAIYCGNNEIAAFMGGDFWGSAKNAFRNKDDSMTVINTYKDFFHQLLPAVVKAYDDDRFYWSTSPQADNYSLYTHDSRTSGDVHYWDVWGGGKPIESYTSNVGPFMTEYGFQSFPDMETIQKFAQPADYDIDSEVLKSHQRSYTGNKAILNYMKNWYKVPSAFPDFLYTGQVLQAEAIKLAIEAHRRAKPYCMGSLYWQIDDCWPAASWSSMDYYGNWKALQYEAKRAFANVIVSPAIKNDSLMVYIVSDSLKAFNAKLSMQLMDLKGRLISQKAVNVTINANDSRIVYTAALKQLLKQANRENLVLVVQLLQQDKQLAKNLLYFDQPKNLELIKAKINYKLTKAGSSYLLQLTANSLQKNLRISAGSGAIIFSDNYFDLIPGEVKVVAFQSSKPLTDSDICFKSINDTTN